MSNEKTPNDTSETNPNADAWSSLEDFNSLEGNTDSRIDDINKAYEMAKAEDGHRTKIAAAHLALKLLSAASAEGIPQKSLTVASGDRHTKGTLTGEYIEEKKSETAVDAEGNIVEDRFGKPVPSYSSRQMNRAIKLIDRDLNNEKIENVIRQEEAHAKEASRKKGDAYDILYGKDKRN